LETGLSLVLLLVCCTVGPFAPPTVRARVTAGGLLGLLVLARIDNALFVAVASTLWLLIGSGTFASRLERVLVVAAAAAVVTLPWWLFNLDVGASVVPSSAREQIEFEVSGGRLALAAGTALRGLLNTGYPGYLSNWGTGATYVAVASLAGLAGLGVALTTRPPIVRDWAAAAVGAWRERPAALAAVLFAVVLVPTYAIFSRATHFYPRYLSVWGLIGAAAVSWVVARRPDALGIALRAVCVTWIVSQLALRLANNAYLDRNPYLDHVELVNGMVPAGERVAAFQSGTLGYFRDNVVNLDGKVNFAALQARRRGHLPAYLRDEAVNWLCDWEGGLRGELGPALDRDFSKVGTRGSAVLYRRSAQISAGVSAGPLFTAP
jgi:hypothetical protein